MFLPHVALNFNEAKWTWAFPFLHMAFFGCQVSNSSDVVNKLCYDWEVPNSVCFSDPTKHKASPFFDELLI